MLFEDLFVVNEDGLIVTLIPPTKEITYEIWLFVSSLMQQQHIRQMYKEFDELKKQFNELKKQL